MKGMTEIKKMGVEGWEFKMLREATDRESYIDTGEWEEEGNDGSVRDGGGTGGMQT